MLGGIGAGGQLAFHGGDAEQVGVGHEGVHGVHALVEVVLDLVEVAVVLVSDLGGDVALGDAVHVAGGHVQGADDGVEAVIHALHDLAVVALVLGGVGAGGQLAFHGRLVEHGGVGHEGLEVAADLLEGRRDLVLVVRSDPLPAQVAVGDLLQAADDALEVVGEAVHGPGQLADLVLAVHVQPHAEVALGHLLHHLDALRQGAGDGLGEDQADADREQHRDAHDRIHHRAGRGGQDGIVLGHLLGGAQLGVLQVIQRLDHVRLLLGALAPHEGFGVLALAGLGQGQAPCLDVIELGVGGLVDLEAIPHLVGEDRLLEGGFGLVEIDLDLLDPAPKLLGVTGHDGVPEVDALALEQLHHVPKLAEGHGHGVVHLGVGLFDGVDLVDGHEAHAGEQGGQDEEGPDEFGSDLGVIEQSHDGTPYKAEGREREGNGVGAAQEGRACAYPLKGGRLR